MGRVQEELFIKINSQFDAVGMNQGLEILNKLNQVLKDTSKYLIENTLVAWSAFEDELIAVKKTTGLAGKDFDNLKNSLMNMSAETGQSVEGLAKIAATAGQLGVKKEDLVGFTDQINKMAIALDFTAEKAAESGAKIANSFQLKATAETMQRIGDIVNTLSDNTAAAAGPIVGFMQQFGGAAKQMGMDMETAAAFGATLISTGMDASDAATRLTTALDKMVMVGKKGGGGAAAAGSLLGMTAQQFQLIASRSRDFALDMVVRALEKIPDKTQRAQKAFEIFGQIGKKAILPLIGNMDTFIKNWELATDKTSTMQKEYENVMQSLSKQWSVFTQNIKLIGIAIGEVIGKDVKKTFDVINPMLKKFSEDIRNNPELINKMATAIQGVVIAAGSLSVALGATGLAGAMAGSINAIRTLIGGGTAASAATGATTAAGSGAAVGGLIGTLGTGLMWLGGIGVAAFGSLYIGKWIGEIKEVQNAFDGLLDMMGLTDFSEYETELGPAARGRGLDFVNTRRNTAQQAIGRQKDQNSSIEISFQKTGDDFVDFILDNLVARARGRVTCDCSCG